LRPVDATVAANAADPSGALCDAELFDRLEAALAALPPAERAAAVVAFGMDEGTPGVAAELHLTEGDAEALTRSALQLLRGALADLELGRQPSPFPRLVSRGRRRPAAD
jgi:DNA-directed RNA polymerase specialized sigma24 family protein